METKIKVEVSFSVCAGCLCTSRKLERLGQFSELFFKLSPNFNELDNNKLQSRDTLICWECHHQLYKIQNFQSKIKQAQKALLSDTNMYKQEGYNCLSSLVATTKTEYDCKIDYEQVRDITIKVEINAVDYIKTDNVDNKFNYFMEPEVVIGALQHVKSDIKCNVPESRYIHKEEIELKNERHNNKFGKLKKDKSPSEHMQKIKKSTLSKCKILAVNEQFIRKDKCYKLVDIGAEETSYWFNEQKKSMRYCSRFQCDKCHTSYYNENRLAKHQQKSHNLTPTSLMCGICSITFQKKSVLENHVQNHYKKFVCLLCQFECYKRWQMYLHYSNRHTKIVECLKCGLRFEKKSEFNLHHKTVHSKFVCDHCGKSTYKKYVLEHHIKLKHTPIVCKYCGSKFRRHEFLNQHMKIKHVFKPTEDTYCVECNQQYNNDYAFKMHLKSSSKHLRKNKNFPCPLCEKVYTRRWSLNNHVSHFHEKTSKYYCDKCARYFLHRFRLLEHIASVHDKISPPKNKLCPYCGRGFKDNRELTNHIRTHTGEKPYACENCTASFAQKIALSSHVKAIHLKIKRK